MTGRRQSCLKDFRARSPRIDNWCTLLSRFEATLSAASASVNSLAVAHLIGSSSCVRSFVRSAGERGLQCALSFGCCDFRRDIVTYATQVVDYYCWLHTVVNNSEHDEEFYLCFFWANHRVCRAKYCCWWYLDETNKVGKFHRERLISDSRDATSEIPSYRGWNTKFSLQISVASRLILRDVAWKLHRLSRA